MCRDSTCVSAALRLSRHGKMRHGRGFRQASERQSDVQDLTTGSVTRHLLKTTSFMLVTMVFQTLYFLVDLYWVGRLGKEAVAGVGVAGNLTFIVLAAHADARRRHDDAGLARGRPQGSRPRACCVFNQSQVLSLVVRRGVPRRRRWRCACRYARALGADAATARARGRLPALVHPGDGAAVRDGRDGLGAARHRQLQARDDRADRDGRHQHGARAGADLRLGHGHPMGVAGAAISTLVAVVVGVVWLSRYFIVRATRTCTSAGADWQPRFELVERAC